MVDSWTACITRIRSSRVESSNSRTISFCFRLGITHSTTPNGCIGVLLTVNPKLHLFVTVLSVKQSATHLFPNEAIYHLLDYSVSRAPEVDCLVCFVNCAGLDRCGLDQYTPVVFITRRMPSYPDTLSNPSIHMPYGDPIVPRPTSSHFPRMMSSDADSDARTLMNEINPAATITEEVRSTKKGEEASNYAHIENAKPNPSNPPFSRGFLQRGDPEVAKARMIYMKSYISGLLMVVITIFVVFSIYWGSLWKVPAHPLKGWIVDFDGGSVGQNVTQDLSGRGRHFIRWETASPSRFSDVAGVIEAIKQEQTWVAVVINEGATSNLLDAVANPNVGYNGSAAITIYGAEARNENVYRSFIRPVVQTSLDAIKMAYAIQFAAQLSQSLPSDNIVSLLSISPQVIVSPISYTIVNLLPFDQPVASAVVFVGLIYLLILSFFIVMIAYSAREVSRMNNILRLRSLIILRLVSSFFGYCFLSFFYSLLNLSFKLDLTRKYGNGGFFIFWMLNWAGMLAVGLALESLITILTPKFIPFFMILWIIADVSVCIFPIDFLPRIYHYGYGAPFYNISNSIRSLAFGTKDTIGLNFGVLFVWIFVSCMTLMLLQWYVRRKARRDIESQSANPRTLGTMQRP